MNAKDAYVGVLVRIPEYMMPIYESIAETTGTELSDVISQDIRAICDRHYEEWRTKDERKDS